MKKIAVLFVFFVFALPRVVFAYLLYAPNPQENKVYVVDSITNTVVTTISVGNTPIAAEVTPNGQFVYVCNQSSNTVSVIQAATNSVIHTISVGTRPTTMAITPDGQFVYVCNTSSNNVSVIQTSNFMVLPAITVGTQPTGIAITPNGQFAYVTNFGTGDVSVIQTSNNMVIATIGTDLECRQVAITPDGQFAYVLTLISVYVIQTSNNTIFTIIDTSHVRVEPLGIAINPNGQFVYVLGLDEVTRTVTQGEGWLLVIQTSNNMIISKAIPIGTTFGSAAVQPIALVVTPDGNFAYASALATGAIALPTSIRNNVFSIVNIQLNNNQVVMGFGNQVVMGVGFNPFLPAQVGIAPASASPPAAVGNATCSQINTGQQKKNDFAIAYERYNLLQWSASASPGGGLAGYYVYRGNELIATLGPSTLQYEDHNRKKGETTTYSIIAFSTGGQQSPPFKIVVTP